MVSQKTVYYLLLHLGNAIANAATPVMDELCKGDGYVTLDASGLSVGLPDGLMGNSEVGHLNIGAGRVVYQVNMGLFIRTEAGISVVTITV